jgi:phosphatidylglycerol:prolipoprotein diacylglycerol transferase
MYPTLSDFIKDICGYSIPLPIQTFGLFAALAFLAATQILVLELKRKEKEGLLHPVITKNIYPVPPYKLVSAISLIAAISGIIGARLFSILEYPAEFFEDPINTLFSTSGFTFYGGMLIGMIAVMIYAQKLDLKKVHLLDAAAPALMLAYCIGRIGCHLSGDGDWGIENLASKPHFLNFLPDWLWAFDYPHNVIKAGVHIENCIGRFCTVLEHPVFPTPVYESILCFLLFCVLWFTRKKINIPGVLFCLYLVFNGAERLIIEQIRTDAEYNILGTFIKQSEIIGLVCMLSGLGGILLLRKKNHKSIP